LTFFQSIYDLALILQDFIPSIIFVFFNYLGWTAATLFSNLMSTLLLYIYISEKSISIKSNYIYYCSITIIPALINSIITLYYFDTQYQLMNLRIQVYFRLISIFYNIIILIILKTKIEYNGPSSVSSIYIFTHRLKYYIFVLIFARFWSTWYEIQYNISQQNNDPESASILQNLVWVMAGLFTPSAGIGYFIVFVNMHPGAVSVINKLYLYILCNYINNNNNFEFSDKSDLIRESLSIESYVSREKKLFSLDDEELLIELDLESVGSGNIDYR
jgi:hypothetical protein